MGKKRTGDPFLCLPEELKTVCSPDTSEVLKRAMKGSPVDDPLLFFVPNPAWDQEPSNQTPGSGIGFSPPDHALLYLRDCFQIAHRFTQLLPDQTDLDKRNLATMKYSYSRT